MWLPVLLFALTVVTTVLAGFFLHLEFISDTEDQLRAGLAAAVGQPWRVLAGLPYSVAILSILLAHEMGHYLACRYHGIQASLPHVIPAPPPLVPFGTFGAVIRIRSMFRDRRQLFDVGIAGPLAGFVVLIPFLILGVSESREFSDVGNTQAFFEFGEPLLFQWVTEWFFPGDSTYIRLHPVGWAAWFGLLATSLNLLPISQLDGGHIAYALFGEGGHYLISRVTFVGLVLVSFAAWPMLGYLAFALILLLLRFRHPPPLWDGPPLGQGRVFLAWLALLVFIVSFIPVPVRLVENVGRL
ncbi:MAG TPA: site-2 protease family protein [Acidobacteriota bacterium]|nr:site-2 protease family protein [Acidobacteriota bacterium]HRR27313.1 site-2 protease family protein [Acidobacteriota bacterium]HRV07048.1 site-2 protease family protein [Acidobacteriota bacterium]